MMQWFVNEVRENFRLLGKKVDEAIAEHVKNQIEAAEKITKLEGELRALKARMGKKQN